MTEITSSDLNELRQNEIVQLLRVVDDDIDRRTSQLDRWRRGCRKRWKRGRRARVEQFGAVDIDVGRRDVAPLIGTVNERQDDVAIAQARIESQLLTERALTPGIH